LLLICQPEINWLIIKQSSLARGIVTLIMACKLTYISANVCNRYKKNTESLFYLFEIPVSADQDLVAKN
jgi:hypothetical protein